RVQDTLTILSMPRALTSPISMARSSGAMAPRPGGYERRSSAPGISALTRQGLPRNRCAARSRACATRAATAALDSANFRSLSSSARPTGSNSTLTSTRSSSGPDNRPRYRRLVAGLHEHFDLGEAAALAHGHG